MTYVQMAKPAKTQIAKLLGKWSAPELLEFINEIADKDEKEDLREKMNELLTDGNCIVIKNPSLADLMVIEPFLESIYPHINQNNY